MLETLNQALGDLAERQIYDTVNDMVNKPVFYMVNLSEKERSILTLIRKNTNITMEQLVKKTSFSRSTVTRIFAYLGVKNLLKRTGSDKTGEWIVLSDYF